MAFAGLLAVAANESQSPRLQGLQAQASCHILYPHELCHYSAEVQQASAAGLNFIQVPLPALRRSSLACDPWSLEGKGQNSGATPSPMSEQGGSEYRMDASLHVVQCIALAPWSRKPLILLQLWSHANHHNESQLSLCLTTTLLFSVV